MSTEKGASIYISAAELEGLSQARGLLSMLVESADTISLEMMAAFRAIDNVSGKARKARRASGRRHVVARALKVADQDE